MNYEISECYTVIEKKSKLHDDFDEEKMKFEKEIYEEYEELLSRNRGIKEELNNLEDVTQEANKIFNNINNDLKDNKRILKEKSENLEKIKSDNEQSNMSNKTMDLDGSLIQMDTRRLKLQQKKANFCIYKEVFG